MNPLFYLFLCALGGVLPYVCTHPRLFRAALYAWSTAVFAAGIYLGGSAFGATAPKSALWLIDAASGLVVILISFIQWSATIAGVRQLTREVAHGAITERQLRHYGALFALFVTSMATAALSNNLGLQWIALEATTLATTLLVAFYAKPGAVEAAWKYLILCSTGITIALVGILLAFYASELAGAGATNLTWSSLRELAPALSPFLMQLAFIFILIGYGTKAGLVPLHAWLPDAHGTAPAPVSALLSGVLLPVAFLAVVRFKGVADSAIGNAQWSGNPLIVFGLLSVCIPAFFILLQQDYKRLLAYSSIEHMGMVALSFGFGGIAAIAGVIHLVGHALIKSALFFGAGSILTRFKSTKIGRVHGLVNALPYTAAFFLAGVFALLAVPPSPLFLSEYLLVAVGLEKHPFAVAILLGALTIAAAGFVRQLMSFLTARDSSTTPAAEKERLTDQFVVALHALVIGALGVILWTPFGFSFVERIAAAALGA